MASLKCYKSFEEECYSHGQSHDHRSDLHLHKPQNHLGHCPSQGHGHGTHGSHGLAHGSNHDLAHGSNHGLAHGSNHGLAHGTNHGLNHGHDNHQSHDGHKNHSSHHGLLGSSCHGKSEKTHKDKNCGEYRKKSFHKKSKDGRSGNNSCSESNSGGDSD